MAAGVIRNFLPAPGYFPMVFQCSPCEEEEEDEEEEEEEEKVEEKRADEEEEEEEEEEEDAASEAQEEDLAGLDVAFPPPARRHALDVTKQLLRFADAISRDVRRYFGRASGDQDAREIYSDSVSVATSGRLRYYDDLLRIARAGNAEEQEATGMSGGEDAGDGGGGGGGLGPLAELFEQRAPGQNRGQPMSKRHLPLSFWTEPVPCCSLVGYGPRDEPSHHADADTHLHYGGEAHTHEVSSQPDFSDLLAHWDPNLELTHTLTDNTHMQD